MLFLHYCTFQYQDDLLSSFLLHKIKVYPIHERMIPCASFHDFVLEISTGEDIYMYFFFHDYTLKCETNKKKKKVFFFTVQMFG